jgi:hypothetical protein
MKLVFERRNLETRSNRMDGATRRASGASVRKPLSFTAFLHTIKPPPCFSGLEEVQISLDFITGERSIVTFRFSAGDTMMLDRIHVSRGM